MKVNTRGQAALEFLMTYGWAILVISVILIVAWQWGLFNIGGTVTPTASGFWGVMPSDFRLDSNFGNLEISLANTVGGPITVTELNATLRGSSVVYSGISLAIPTGSTATFTMSGLPTGKAGDTYELFLTIRYLDNRTPTYEHWSAGKIIASYEQ